MKKILMIILDGFGLKEDANGNAVKLAKMPFFNRIWNEYPHSVLNASGEAVGLPDNIFGNSEVCHQVIGLGKKIKQKLTIAHDEIESKKIMKNEELISLVKHVKERESTLHLMGLVSDGGVHSHVDYIINIIPVLKEMGVKKIIFHAITDGRDTYRMSALNYLGSLDAALKKSGIGHIGTVCGRYYAMDRDSRYERTKIYYNLVRHSIGLNIANMEIAINNCYIKSITDEFLPPLCIDKESRFREGDGLLWLNFRTDRSKQIINSFTNPEFKPFFNEVLNDFKVCTMFPEIEIEHANPIFVEASEEELYPIGEYFADLGFTQARIAETEKYSHVTKFFNSEKVMKYKNNDNFAIESPKVLADQAPGMSANEVTDQTIKCLEKDYDFILTNFCNPDMVGHTGNLDATIKGLEFLDSALEELVQAAEDNFYKIIILSDHGNADTMLDEKGRVVTTHSTNPVPFIILDKGIKLRENGDLTQVAPTLLSYVDLAIPKDMKGSKSLLIQDL